MAVLGIPPRPPMKILRRPPTAVILLSLLENSKSICCSYNGRLYCYGNMLARVCHDLLGTPSIRFKGSMSGVFIDTNDHPLNYHCKRTYFHHASGPLPTKLVHQCHLVHYLDQVCACVRAYVRANTCRYMCIVCIRIPPVGARVRGG